MSVRIASKIEMAIAKKLDVYMSEIRAYAEMNVWPPYTFDVPTLEQTCWTWRHTRIRNCLSGDDAKPLAWDPWEQRLQEINARAGYGDQSVLAFRERLKQNRKIPRRQSLFISGIKRRNKVFA